MIHTTTNAQSPAADAGQPLLADASDADQINAQLAHTGPRLRFPDSRLEGAFRCFFEQYSLAQVRPALLVLMALIVLFGVADLANFPPAIYRETIALRLCVVPFLAWTYWRTYRMDAKHKLDASLVLAAAVCGAVAVGLVYIPHAAGLQTPYEGLMLFMFGIGGFLGLRFVYALSILSLMTLLYVAAELAAHAEPVFLANSGFRLACTAVVASFGAYLSERQVRQVYLHRMLLESYALRDGLTGIANRRAFDAHAIRVAQQASRARKPITVMIIDADHFKQYNDTYGHALGDTCLQRLAMAIKKTARRPLDLAARYGGEEFVLLLFDVNAEQAQHLAAGIQARIEKLAIPHANSPVSGNVTVSGGIATRGVSDTRPLEELVADADRALYHAKSRGRNRFVHFSSCAWSPQAAAPSTARPAMPPNTQSK